MNHHVTLRHAQEKDVAAIAGLLTQLNSGEGYVVVSSPEEIRSALFAPAREVHLHALIAQQGDVIIATLLYYAGYDTLSASVGYHVADMVVHDSHRREGVGKALMHALAGIALAEEKSWVSLTALKENSGAQAFYMSLGMTRVNVDFYAIGKSALMQM